MVHLVLQRCYGVGRELPRMRAMVTATFSQLLVSSFNCFFPERVIV
jgi:hypothetical protein